MQTTAPPPFPAPPLPARPLAAPPVRVPPRPAAGGHRAPAPARLRSAAVAVLVLVVGLAATAVALTLPSRATRTVDAALEQLRGWPSITVDGTLSPGGAGMEPVDVHATVTADGSATGALTRPGGAKAELAVGPGATLLRGNRQWWHDRPPGLTAQLTHRWVTGAREGAVDQLAVRRLTPAAVAGALAALRDPDGRTEADTQVYGAPATSFARNGVRLVVDGLGRPVAVDVPVPADDALPAPGGPGAPAAPTAQPAPPSSLSLVVARAGSAEDAAARRAVADVLEELGAARPDQLPSLDAIVQREARAAVAPPLVDVTAERGCRPSACTVRVTLTNTRATPVSGLFVLEVGGRVVRSEMLTLPARRETALMVPVPARVLATTARSGFLAEATFDPTVGRVTTL